MKAPSESKGGKLRKGIVRGNHRCTGSVTMVRGLSPFQSLPCHPERSEGSIGSDFGRWAPSIT